MRHASARLLFTGLLLLALPEGRAAAQDVGPDVTVFTLQATNNYGSIDGIRGYSVATTACNAGTEPLAWCTTPSSFGCNGGVLTGRDHPVIAQNMYRLKNGRFEQLGASWLKHGFQSLNTGSNTCGPTGTCTQPPLGDRQLGVGCIDAYTANENGHRPAGRKSEVDPATGAFPYPSAGGGSVAAMWNQRLAVAEADLEASLNPGAAYYLEGHYVTADDAMAGNGLNNASYRQVTIQPGTYDIVLAFQPVRQKAAIKAWAAADPEVEMLDLDLPTAPVERFHVARKVTDLGNGRWHYEYAIHNMNSKRAADGLRIDFGEPVFLSNAGFHDVDSHSGEPYDVTDWEISTPFRSVRWAAPFFTPPENANALRWGTLYSFWFDASRPPTAIESHTLSLFEAGMPAEMVFLETPQVPETTLFADGFESGGTAAWSSATPGSGP